MLARDRRLVVEGDRRRPVGSERRYRVAAKFLANDGLALRGFEELRGHAARGQAAQHRFQARAHLEGAYARCEGRGCHAKLALGEVGVRNPFGVERLAGIDERLQWTTLRAEHLLKKVGREEIRAVDAGKTERECCERICERARAANDLSLERFEMRDGMRRNRALRYVFEGSANLSQHGLLIDVAGDDEHGVIGRVPTLVESLELRPGQAIERRDRADALASVRRAGERECLRVAEEIAARRRFIT